MNDQKRSWAWFQWIDPNINTLGNQKMALLCIECVKDEKLSQ